MKLFAVFFCIFAVALAVVYGLPAEKGNSQMDADKSTILRDDHPTLRSGLFNYGAQHSGHHASHEDSHQHPHSHSHEHLHSHEHSHSHEDSHERSEEHQKTQGARRDKQTTRSAMKFKNGE